MTDNDERTYVIAQPTAHGKPSELTIRVNGKVITYSEYRGIEESSNVYPNMLEYGERTIEDVPTDISFEVTD
jgi:hypothetical protein